MLIWSLRWLKTIIWTPCILPHITPKKILIAFNPFQSPWNFYCLDLGSESLRNQIAISRESSFTTIRVTANITIDNIDIVQGVTIKYIDSCCPTPAAPQVAKSIRSSTMHAQYWEPGTQYNYGDVVQYEGVSWLFSSRLWLIGHFSSSMGSIFWSGHRYKIIQPHFSQVRRYAYPVLLSHFISHFVDHSLIGPLVPLLLPFGDV